MQESIKLHTHCPSCQAPKDYDTQGARHYTCGTYGRFLTGVYVRQCSLPRMTCSNCDAATKLIQAQTEEIKRLRAALAKTGCADLLCQEADHDCHRCATKES